MGPADLLVQLAVHYTDFSEAPQGVLSYFSVLFRCNLPREGEIFEAALEHLDPLFEGAWTRRRPRWWTRGVPPRHAPPHSSSTPSSSSSHSSFHRRWCCCGCCCGDGGNLLPCEYYFKSGKKISKHRHHRKFNQYRKIFLSSYLVTVGRQTMQVNGNHTSSITAPQFVKYATAVFETDL